MNGNEIEWVSRQTHVEAVTRSGDVFDTGRVIAYSDVPTFVIEKDNGERFSWAVELTRKADT